MYVDLENKIEEKMSFHIKIMSTNYRNLFAFIFVCFGAGSAIAQTKFEPLDDYLAARPKWNKEPNELSYVGMRCASLFWVIAGHFQANGNNKEHEETAEKLKKYMELLTSQLPIQLELLRAEQICQKKL